MFRNMKSLIEQGRTWVGVQLADDFRRDRTMMCDSMSAEQALMM